jgi:uncharacterized protein YqkB
MKITIKNYDEFHNKIKKSELPVNVHDAYDTVVDAINSDFSLTELAEQDSEFVDLYLKSVNEYFAEDNTSAKETKPEKSVKEQKTNPVKPKKELKPDKEPKPKKMKKSGKEKLVTPPAWLIFIRKFVTYYANKSVKVETLTKYTEALQDKFQSNPKRAKTENIEILKLIQEILVKAVNNAGRKDKVKVEVSDTYLSVMKTAIRNFTVARGKDRVYPKFENTELSGTKKKVRK